MAFDVVDMLYFEPYRVRKARDAWKDAKRRCYDPEDSRYYSHGARGVEICDEWVDDFWAFYQFVGPPPTLDRNSILDRVDNNRSYEPGNVRWTNTYISALNKNKYRTNTSGLKGLSYYTLSDRWAVKRTIFGQVHRKTFAKREQAIAYWFELDLLAQQYISEREGQ